MNVAFSLSTAPVLEPVSLAEAKAHLRVEHTTDDTLITALIKAARAQVEEYLSRALLTQTWTYRQDAWTDTIHLPRAAPLQSISTVKYYDDAGVEQTLSSSIYLADTLSEPGRILLAPNQTWPTAQDRPLAITVTYVCGWTAAASVPDAIKWAVLLTCGSLYAQREDLTIGVEARQVGAAEALLAPHRVWWRPPC